MIKKLNLQLELDAQRCDIFYVTRPTGVLKQRYATAICDHAGATPEQLRANQPVEEWDTKIIVRTLPLEKLGLGKAKVELRLSGLR